MPWLFEDVHLVAVLCLGNLSTTFAYRVSCIVYHVPSWSRFYASTITLDAIITPPDLTRKLYLSLSL